jgi:hypothetical protein
LEQLEQLVAFGAVGVGAVAVEAVGKDGFGS